MFGSYHIDDRAFHGLETEAFRNGMEIVQWLCSADRQVDHIDTGGDYGNALKHCIAALSLHAERGHGSCAEELCGKKQPAI